MCFPTPSWRGLQTCPSFLVESRFQFATWLVSLFWVQNFKTEKFVFLIQMFAIGDYPGFFFNQNVLKLFISCTVRRIKIVIYGSQQTKLVSETLCIVKFCFKFHMWHCWVKRIQPKYKNTRAVSGSAGAALGPLYQVANSICNFIWHQLRKWCDEKDVVQSKSTSDLLLCLKESDIKVILSYLGFIFKAGLKICIEWSVWKSCG